jgi:alkylation response protein AidB-like acyl-CoA dehydrogenase
MSGRSLNDEQAAVVELVDRIVADVPAPTDDDAECASRAVLVEQGLFSLAMPESVGGGGGGLPVLVAFLGRLGRDWPAVGLACAHAHAAVHVLAARPEWREAAEAVAAGGPVALVEGSGLHLDGGLRGAPVRVDVGSAEPAMVVVEPDGVRGRAVLVPVGSAAASVGPLLRRSGLAGAGTRWISFPGERPDAVSDDLPTTAAVALLHLGTAAVACGLAAGALDAAVGYVRGREQFGAPLVELPTIRSTVFDAHAAVLGVQHQVADLADVAAAGHATEPDAAAAAVRSATEVAVQVATAGVQLHGGYGYLTDYPAERFLRDAVSLRAAAATSTVVGRSADRLLLAAT